MSDAPERIWATHAFSVGYYFTAKGQQPRFYDVEYIRADLHAAEIAKLQARVNALVVVVNRLLPVARHYGGLTDDHVSAIKDAEATIRNFQIVPTVKESLTTDAAIEAARG